MNNTYNLKLKINQPLPPKFNLTANKIVDLIGWLGASFMIAFSFTLNLPFAILGLILLTIQAYKKDLKTLVILNLISILGFIINATF